MQYSTGVTIRSSIVAILIGFAFETAGSSRLMAQLGSRLYLRFDDNTPTDYEGLRIRLSEDQQRYWVLGRGYLAGWPLPYGVVAPPALARVTAAGTVVSHSHYVAGTSPYTGDVGSPSDFCLNDGNSVTLSALKVVGSPCQYSDLSLFKVYQNMTVAGSTTYDYRIPTRKNFSGSSILIDPTFTPERYIVTYNTFDSLLQTDPLDWGIMAVDTSNWNTVNWNSVFTYAGSSVYEEARDMCLSLDNNGTSSYAVCGVRTNGTTQLHDGLITRVSNTGTVMWQKQYTAPTGNALEFNCITEFEAVNVFEYVITGTIIPGNTQLARSIIWMGVNRDNGNVLWSYRYFLADNDDCEAFHHAEYLGKNFVCAGRVTHRDDGHTSGMLMEIEDQLIHPSDSCDALLQWWRVYDTNDAYSEQVVDTELRDVIPKINGDLHDVAAVGTSQVRHSYQLIKDVLWLATETDGSSNPGRSYSGQNDPDDSNCFDYELDHGCEPIEIVTTSLTPSIDDKPNILNTKLNDFDDSFWRDCDSNNDGLQHYSSPKTFVSDSTTTSERLLHSSGIQIFNSTSTASFVANIQGNPGETCLIRLFNSIGVEVELQNNKVFLNSAGFCDFVVSTSCLYNGLYCLSIYNDRFSHSTRVIIAR